MSNYIKKVSVVETPRGMKCFPTGPLNNYVPYFHLLLTYWKVACLPPLNNLYVYYNCITCYITYVCVCVHITFA